MIKLKTLIKEEKYEFTNTMKDYHSGQAYMNAYATLNDIVVGRVDYSVFEDKVYIDYVEVADDHRRKGIATQLMDFIKKENKDMEIIPGFATDDGHKFWQKYRKKLK